jgi:hypothetical protein
MTGDELYRTYYKWTAQLHRMVADHLGEHVDVEYFPDDWVIKVYSGWAVEFPVGMPLTTVPGYRRPDGEGTETIRLPRPEDNPTQGDLDNTFRKLCVAVAHVLGITLAQLTLQ